MATSLRWIRANAVQTRFSLDLGQRLAMEMTGGSDAHRVEELGAAATQFQRKITGLADLIEELREVRFQGLDLRTGDETDPVSS